MLALHLARFQVDATPPIGHPLCGGWIKSVVGVDDPLSFRGIALLGDRLPIVLASLDFTGVQNGSHRQWTEALAQAARTTPDRVALHCVHQHNAPFVDLAANRLLHMSGATTTIYEEAFIDDLMRRSSAAVRDAVDTAVPARHVSTGAAEVKQVACNRRVIGPDGKIRFTRTSATTDPEARAAPEGTIDPILRSVTLLGDRAGSPLARLYSYATHPMSYYGDGRVTSDFVGLARRKRGEEEPETLHVYFTGCAGNVTAGKYNDGSHENRPVLTGRVHQAMQAADTDAIGRVGPLDTLRWTTSRMDFAPREDLDADALRKTVADPNETTANRHRAAMAWAWLARVESRYPILLGRLDVPGARFLFLPAETFVEYQLEAQQVDPATPLFTAAYGDGGPWYIPLDRSFDEGGYEPSVSWVSKRSEKPYREAIRKLLA